VQWREDGGGRAAAKERDSLHAAAGGAFLDRAPLLDIERISLPRAAGGADVDRALAVYRASPLVLAAEPDGPARAASAAWPDDSAFAAGLQWGLTRTAWVQAYAAWQAGQIVLGTQIVVAVLDTGVGPHSDLGTQVLGGASMVASEPDTTDHNGHGTMCAGLIAATPANGSGIAGAFFDPALIRILPVKVLDACGGGSDSTISYGLLYAAQQGARVANMSVVLSGTNDVVRNAVTEAARRGMVLVAASGNDESSVPYPASLPDVISVGALDASDAPAYYDNYGKVDLSAPGGAGINACPCASSAVGCNGDIL
jgi:subtilisin family serine protease